MLRAIPPEVGFTQGDALMIQQQVQKRRRGNPRWNQGKELEVPDVPSAFEKMLKRLGLTLGDDCARLAEHPKVGDWVRKHYRARFVPEGVLKALGLSDWSLAGDGARAM
jgi:hypothetical protein